MITPRELAEQIVQTLERKGYLSYQAAAAMEVEQLIFESGITGEKTEENSKYKADDDV
jgi:hypothetical protein